MTKDSVRLAAVVLVLGCSALATGCGDDDGGEPDGAAGMSGAPSAGSGGSGGSGGGGGSGGSGGGSGSTSTAPVECGDVTCASAAPAMGFMTACCVDAATGTCGVSIMGNACSVPPESDPRCPSVDIGGVFMLASCCTSDGDCGIDASQFGQGCVELSQAEAGAMMQGGAFMIDFPDPQRCEDDDGGVDADGGQ